MRQVHAWVVQRSTQPLEILTRARRHDEGVADSAIVQLDNFLQMPQRTQGSVVTTINNCLRFMSHPGVVAMLTPRPGDRPFDFDAFLTSRDTLYMISGDATNSPVAPLFCAFLGELVHHARTVGSGRPDITRIDPPITLLLDEIANVAPIPIWQWASWLAGSGITAVIYAQSLAQLVNRWGKDEAEALWNACRTKVFYGANTEKDVLTAVSDLYGDIRLRVADDDHYDQGKRRRRYHTETTKVLPFSEVRQLPETRAVVIHDAAKPIIITVEDVYRRADYRLWKRSGEPILLPAPHAYVRATPNPQYAAAAPEHASPGEVADELAKRRTQRNPTDAPPLQSVPARRTGQPAQRGQATWPGAGSTRQPQQSRSVPSSGAGADTRGDEHGRWGSSGEKPWSLWDDYPKTGNE